MITLRVAVPQDVVFLARLYGDIRRREVSAWGWPAGQQEWFLQMQFDAQKRSYLSSFPDALDRVILLEDVPIGRILTNHEPSSMRLIDIALLEEQRQQGIGTYLLRNLIQECQEQDCPLRLQVAEGNPAMRLYQRVGFEQTGSDAMYITMEWLPLPRQKVAAS
jgi:GNAT superfamily N-acetyltransferase